MLIKLCSIADGRLRTASLAGGDAPRLHLVAAILILTVLTEDNIIAVIVHLPLVFREVERRQVTQRAGILMALRLDLVDDKNQLTLLLIHRMLLKPAVHGLNGLFLGVVVALPLIVHIVHEHHLTLGQRPVDAVDLPVLRNVLTIETVQIMAVGITEVELQGLCLRRDLHSIVFHRLAETYPCHGTATACIVKVDGTKSATDDIRLGRGNDQRNLTLVHQAVGSVVQAGFVDFLILHQAKVTGGGDGILHIDALAPVIEAEAVGKVGIVTALLVETLTVDIGIVIIVILGEAGHHIIEVAATRHGFHVEVIAVGIGHLLHADHVGIDIVDDGFLRQRLLLAGLQEV